MLDAQAHSLLWDGQFDKSMDIALEGELLIEGKTDTNSKYWSGRFLSLKGSIFNFMGDLESAIHYQNRAMEIRIEINDGHGIAESLSKIAMVYKSKNNLSQALNYLLKSLEEFERGRQILKITDEAAWGSILGSARALLEIVLVYIKINEIQKAREYLDKLEEMQTKMATYSIPIWYDLANALIYKGESRLVNQAKAFEILKKLSKIKIRSYDLEALVNFNLCELLIDEFKQYGHLEIFEELVFLIDHMYRRAQKQNLSPMMIEILILKSNLSLIQGNLHETEKILDQALTLANEKGLVSYSDKCKDAQTKFHQNLDEWNELVAEGSSINERIKKLELKDYLGQALELSSQYKN